MCRWDEVAEVWDPEVRSACTHTPDPTPPTSHQSHEPWTWERQPAGPSSWRWNKPKLNHWTHCRGRFFSKPGYVYLPVIVYVSSSHSIAIVGTHLKNIGTLATWITCRYKLPIFNCTCKQHAGSYECHMDSNFMPEGTRWHLLQLVMVWVHEKSSLMIQMWLSSLAPWGGHTQMLFDCIYSAEAIRAVKGLQQFPFAKLWGSFRKIARKLLPHIICPLLPTTEHSSLD